MREIKIEIGAKYPIQEYDGREYMAYVVKIEGNLITLEVPEYEEGEIYGPRR